jgi:hypothetical protein
MDGDVWLVSGEQRRRVEEVLTSWDRWRGQHGDDVGGFLHSAYLGDVGSADVGTLPGATLPWTWVAQYLAARLSDHTNGARGGSSPRNFERLTNPSHVLAHLRLLQEVVRSDRSLAGVVTSNYDLLVERALRPRPVRGWPVSGFHYAGLPRPQIAYGTAQPWRQRDGRRNATIELTGEVPLAKLHGSLNWERLARPHGTARDVKVWQDLRSSFRLDTTPAVVAPIPETEPAPWLEPVWEAAAGILKAADEWLIVGYSLPDYDAAIRGLLGDAARGQRVVVRDPRADFIVGRFRALLPGCDVTVGPAL